MADKHFDVVGAVLGELDGLDGDTAGAVLGEVSALVGRHRRHHRHHSGLQLHKPSWRDEELAPGVVHPGEGLVVLPMTPLQNSGQFTATVVSITWQGQLQKPFRSERLLVSSVRIGTSSVGRLLGQIFVGTDLQMADITGFDTELVGANTAFGTRMTLVQAPPGVLVRIPVTLSIGLTGTDTITGSYLFLGRVVH